MEDLAILLDERSRADPWPGIAVQHHGPLDVTSGTWLRRPKTPTSPDASASTGSACVPAACAPSRCGSPTFDTVPRSKLEARVGGLADEDMVRLGRAIVVFFGLAGA